jgi:DNA-binding NtrC family response regulator
MAGSILIIDDEKDIRNLLARTLQLEGYEVAVAETIRVGLRKLQEEEFYLVLSDVKLPDGNGVELTSQLKEKYPQTEVICLTAYGNIPDGVRAIKNGAFDYLVKGDDNEKILPLVAKALEKAALQFKIKHLQEQLSGRGGFHQVIGHSPVIRQAVQMAQKVAPLDTTVLLTGPTGTGKEVFAKAIHAESERRHQPFVAVNCSAFGRELLESEMFGHKAGAFTGAQKDKKGLLEEAHRGTIFLDELGEMNLDLQAKLLRVLENGTFIKVGETKETQVDVRVVAATNRKLEDEIEKGNFREDLFFRLSVFQIPLPSLDQRKADIPDLVEYFLPQFNSKLKKKIQGASSEYLQALEQHTWKGNIRELRNVLERSIILADTDTLTPDLLPLDFMVNRPAGVQNGMFKLKEMEQLHIQQVLQCAQGNKTKAAELLDIGLTTLYSKIKEYNL